MQKTFLTKLVLDEEDLEAIGPDCAPGWYSGEADEIGDEFAERPSGPFATEKEADLDAIACTRMWLVSIERRAPGRNSQTLFADEARALAFANEKTFGKASMRGVAGGAVAFLYSSSSSGQRVEAIVRPIVVGAETEV